jgi:phosphoethanolamine N-methyltransferase
VAGYTDDFIERVHLVWGEGFLSPGGSDEVQCIVAGLDLKGRRILDIGCGTGGPAVALARAGALVTAIDIEPLVLDRARRLAAAHGVADRLTFALVEPGPLPFPDESFDIVFSKDALIHIADKRALYADVFRVLKTGGRFAASDWLKGARADDDPAFAEYLSIVTLSFAMQNPRDTVRAIEAAGFADVAADDRSSWYAPIAADDVAQIEGPLRERLIAICGEETYTRWLAIRRLLAKVSATGSLAPTHLRAAKPAIAA